LRLKDLDFDYRQITVRNGKGAKDRHTMLPESLAAPLRRQLERVRSVFDSDRARSLPGAAMPPALERKYPSAPVEWAWQFVFPARGVHRQAGIVPHRPAFLRDARAPARRPWCEEPYRLSGQAAHSGSSYYPLSAAPRA